MKSKGKPYKTMENTVLILIGVSSLTLIIDNPLSDPEGQKQQILAIFESIFTILFLAEALIKVIAKGMIHNTMKPITPYLRDPWNILDAFVVVASLGDMVLNMAGINI